MSDSNAPANDPQTQPDAGDGAPEQPALSTATVTSLNGKWSIKMLLITVVLILFGCWALYDALAAYPSRGANAAEYFEYQYLDQIAKNRPPLTNDAGIANPSERLKQLQDQTQKTGGVDPIDDLRLRWLESLALIKHDTPRYTTFPRAVGDGQLSAKDRYDALTKRWTTSQGGTTNAPKPLSAFDIPSQWAILAICWAIGLWVLMTLFTSNAKKYRWDPATQALTLPGGNVITPADIEEIDKRKWDKFYVTVRIKPAHKTLGGKGVEMDLLRFVPLEQWILTMEKTAFPDLAAAAAAGAPTTPTAPDAPAAA